MEELNTMETFEKEGFKIKRNGQVFTLTSEEMSDFRYLDKALDGKNCLECYNATNEETEIVELMMEDEEICYNIEDDILEILYNDAGDIEVDVINDYIERNMEG